MNKNNLKNQSGFSTLEMLITIALAVFFIIPAVMYVSYGSQSLAADSQTNTEALHEAQKNLELALETSRQDYDSVGDSSGSYDIYSTSTKISNVTECAEQVTANVAWTADHNKPATVTLTSLITNIPLMLARGGDCSVSTPTGPPIRTGVDVNLHGSTHPLAIDVLERKLYIAVDDPIGFVIIDETNTSSPICYGITGGGNCTNIPYTSFSDGAQVNDIDVAKGSDNRLYAYLARDTTSQQFEVVDVTNPQNPVSIVKKTLNGLTTPAKGYRVYYYKNKAYITNLETGGAEFHVFDVTTPWDAISITEYANPKDLNRTVTDFVVSDQTISGTDYTVAYLVAKAGLKEVSAWNVTSPTAMAEIPLSVNNLTGSQDGLSVYFSNSTKRLYVGREGGALYIFNVIDPFAGVSGSPGFPQLATANTNGNADPLGIRVSGNYLYLVTPSSNRDFQLFTSDPADFHIINFYGNGSNKGAGLDMEDNIVYEILTQGSSSIQLFYVP